MQRLKKPKERIRSDSKAQASRGAPLHYTRNYAVKEGLEATRRIDSIIVEKKGVKEVEEPQGKTVKLKYFQNPLMPNTREGCQKIPKGQDGLKGEGIIVALGPADTVNVDNV